MQGAGGSEAVRQANVSAAVTIYVPLDWLFFVRSEDYALTPEALASELDLNVLYSTLERMVYARKTSDSTVPTTATLWTTQPAITQSALYTQLIHTTQVEKALHLATYESQQGNVYKILGESFSDPACILVGHRCCTAEGAQFFLFLLRLRLVCIDSRR